MTDKADERTRADVEAVLEALRRGMAPEAEAVRRLMDDAPYFTLPVAVMLARGSGRDPEALARVALNSPDAAQLMQLADRESDTWRNFYPDREKPAAMTSEQAIDAFLETYGHGQDQAEDRLMERLIFQPTPGDYALTLEDSPDAEPEREKTEQDKLVDDFLRQLATSEPEPESEPEPVVATPPHSETLSESLAKIYVRQQKFQEAYEIITSLSLNYPEKSAYFADQLRFLRKLMLNRQHSQQENNEK